MNRDFTAIATELQPLQSLGVFHAGMSLPGTVPLPESYPFSFDPAIPSEPHEPGMRSRCVVLGCFGPRESPASATASHLVVVNSDYKAERTVTLSGPKELEIFDPLKKEWSPLPSDKAGLRLEAGGGRLLRTVK